MTAQGNLHRESILGRYDSVICDLDGVVYRGSHAVPGSIEALTATQSSGRPITFATNNASREPGVVEEHLRSLGLHSGAWGVVSSAQAAARRVATDVGNSGPVLAVGGPGVAHALRETGLTPFSAGDARRHRPAAAVVQGAGSNVNWRDLAEVAHQVRGGALWFATNLDRTIPTARGLAPGNGTLVEAVRTAVEVDPIVVGKPQPFLYELALKQEWMGSGRVLVVGDRLDTDIAAANAAGLDSLWVLGGAHGLVDLVFCRPLARPTHVGIDLRAAATRRLSDEHATVPVKGGVIQMPPAHLPAEELLAAVVTTAWQTLDSGGHLALGSSTWRALERRIVEQWTATWSG